MPSELQKQGYRKKISSLVAFVPSLLGATSPGMGQEVVGKMLGQRGVELMLPWDQQRWWQWGLVVTGGHGGEIKTSQDLSSQRKPERNRVQNQRDQ